MWDLLPTVVLALFLAQHVANYAGDIWSFVAIVRKFCHDCARYLWSLSPKSCEQQERREQAEAALWDVRARTYRHSVQLLVHVAAFGVLGMMHDLFLNPSFAQFFHVFSMMFVYMSHHSVCKEKLTLNGRNLRGIYTVFYTSFTLFVLSNYGRDVDHARAVTDQGFNAGARMMMSVIFIDTLTTLPAQLIIAAAEVIVYAQKHTVQEIGVFAWMQVVLTVGIIAFSVVLEFWITSHLTSLMDTESLVSSFRRMLCGVSDGEMMLTEDMNIAEEPDCLKHLLMTQSQFKGKHFEKLLLPEEVERFQDFMKQSMAEAHKPTEQRTKTPPCLRISLRGASDLRVAVDVWHIGMPHRKDGVRHLLALREDGEARGANSGPQHHCSGANFEAQSPVSTCVGNDLAPSECSFSQKSCTSMLTSFPELAQMTLCVDASTHWFDIEQAHLSFVRQPQSSDGSMPSLRRLVRPNDWETLRSKLKEVTEGCSDELRFRLVDDSKRCIVANQVQVSTFRPPLGSDGLKLCLQMTDMTFDDGKCQRENLTAIDE